MPEPTKADLKAAVAKLTEENAALRDLLAAIRLAAGTVPVPAKRSDELAEWKRYNHVLANIRACSKTGDEWDGYIAWATENMREVAAEPVGYEVYVPKDATAAPSGDGGVLLPAGCDPDAAARGELCHYCDVEPATVTLTNGRYCEACAPGVQLATGANVTEPSFHGFPGDPAPALNLTPKGLAALDSAALAPAAPRVIRSAALPGGAA